MKEIWKEIDGYNGRYEISTFGRLKSYAQDSINGKIKEGNRTFKGYKSARLYDGHGSSKWIPIHRLVASAFIDNPDDLPQVNHIDENKENNRVENLEWCTNEYNAHYGTHIERIRRANLNCLTTSRPVYSIDKNGHIEEYPSIGEAERITGNSHCNIVRQLKGRRKTCGGKRWYYL